MICWRIIVMSSIIAISLFVFAGCQKESVKTDLAIMEKRWRATAVKVEDSGIVWVRCGDQLDKVSLIDIYFPDTSDPQHGNAKKYLEERLLGKTLDLNPVTIDGSVTICEIYVESRCINKDILEDGLAWYFPKHKNNEDLMDLFKKARLDRKGIWSSSEDQIKPPLELRKELAKKENLKKWLNNRDIVSMPFLLYHNPYNPYSSPGSSSKDIFQHTDSKMSAAQQADYYRDRFLKDGNTTDLLNYSRELKKAMEYSK